MSTLQSSTTFCRKRLPLVIATHLLIATHAYAGPSGGKVVGGDGEIQQAGNHTRIDQRSERLAIEWDTFSLRRNESVRFNQPSENSVALNRILDNNGSEILGRIDANGRVILMNPNGVFFGRSATVNVGSLVATGLMIDTHEFLNGDIVMKGMDGTSGAVVNRGMIQAATGGNVALIGKRVENDGLISANLGHVALAAAEQAVLTFDDQGLLGVRIDEATLESKVGVINRGKIQAMEGKILLSGSVTKDLFSRAVNRGDLGGALGAEVHEDGSFSIGSGVGIANNGDLNVASNGSEAGEVFLVGESVVHGGAINAGQVHMLAQDTISLTKSGRIDAHQNNGSSIVTAVADRYIAEANTQVDTDGSVNIRTVSLTRVGPTTANNLGITTSGDVRQSGSMQIRGALNLNLLSLATYADVELTHRDNQFGLINAETSYNSTTSLAATGEVLLGDFTVVDSHLHITAHGLDGAIRQAPNHHLQVGNSQLGLTADHIELGANNSYVTAHHGHLKLYFGQSLDTHQSVDAPGDYNFSSVLAKGTRGPNQVTLNAGNTFDAAIQLFEPETGGGIHIDRLQAESGSFMTLGDINQSGAIALESVDFYLPLTGKITLPHNKNEIHQLNADLGFGSEINLHTSSDLSLHSLELLDVKANLSAKGTINQQNNSHIEMRDALVTLSAHSIFLGQGDSSTYLDSYSSLALEFEHELNTHNSISASSHPDRFNWLDAKSQGVHVTSREVFDVHILKAADATIIHSLTAENAQLVSTQNIYQTGPIDLSGSLDLNLAMQTGGTVNLNHSENTINELTMDLDNTSFYLTNNGSLALGNAAVDGSSVYLTAVGENARIYQKFGSEIYGSNAYLSLTADRIELGADGNADLSLSGIGVLDMDFNRALSLTGGITMRGTYAGVMGRGSDLGNEVFIGEQASFNMNATFTNYWIETGAGNDHVTILSDLPLPVYTVAGQNLIEVANSGILFEIGDYDPKKDTIIYLNP